MASGHVNRTNRPNTWLHRPATRRKDSPCQLGAVHTWHIAPIRTWAASGAKRTLSAFRMRIYEYTRPNRATLYFAAQREPDQQRSQRDPYD